MKRRTGGFGLRNRLTNAIGPAETRHRRSVSRAFPLRDTVPLAHRHSPKTASRAFAFIHRTVTLANSVLVRTGIGVMLWCLLRR